MRTPVEIHDARQLVFGGLIDYAGLFPPASLDMAGAVAGYRSARSSDHNWIVDRFIVPASRLEELAGELAPTMAAGEDPWPLSVLADLGDWPSFETTTGAIAAFSAEMGSAASLELVEVKLPDDPSELDVGDAATAFARSGAVPFFEMPPSGLPLGVLAAARRQRDLAVGAKLRCGGVTPELFPSAQRVAEFIEGCVAQGLPFKCTAGLHHPVRYVAADTGFTHHGFLNIAAAAMAAVEAGRGDSGFDLVEIIGDDDPASFAVTRSGLTWRGHTFSIDVVTAARAGGFVGYGSCDFDEPVADLAELGMLP